MIFKKALTSTEVVELAGMATVMGVNPGLAGWETVTVLARLDVEILITIGMSKFCVLVETSGAANQKAVSVCPLTIRGNSRDERTTMMKMRFFISVFANTQLQTVDTTQAGYLKQKMNFNKIKIKGI
jgi:hypothetical protein